METTAPELSRDLVRLMLMMRRMVKEEFSVTIQLSDPEAAHELLAFADRSRNTLLRQMARELETHGSSPMSEAADSHAAPTSSRYRGAVVPSGDTGTASGSPVASRPKRVYRGQVIV